MIVEVNGERFDVPDDASIEEIDALTRKTPQEPQEPQRPGFGDIQAAEAKREAIETQRNVPAHLLTGYPIDRKRAEAFAEAGQTSRPLTGAQAAKGMALLASPFAGPAVGGALVGAGTSEAETPLEFATDVGVGAAGGKIAAKGLDIAGKYAGRPLLEWLSQKLGRSAERMALRSTGADRLALRRATKDSPEAVQDIGRTILDERVPLRSPAAMREGLQDVMGREGPAIGELVAEADKAGAAVDLGAVAKRVQDEVIAPLLSSSQPEKQAMAQSVTERLAGWLQKAPEGRIPTSAAHELRKDIDDVIRWNTQDGRISMNDQLRSMRGIVSDELGKAVEGAGLGGKWTAANRTFRNAARAEDMARVGAERRAGNALFSPTEKGGGLVGALLAASGEPLSGAALAGGTLLTRRYGAPIAARGLNAASRVIAPGAEAGTSRAVAPAGAATLEELMDFLRAKGLAGGPLPAAAEGDR